MALRIGTPKAAAPPVEEEQPEAEAPVEEAPMMDMMMDEGMPEMKSDMAKASQEAARYLMPEYRCGSCVHFLDAGSDVGECEIVAGPIHPEGSCCLYEPDAEMLAPEDPAMLAETEVPAEVPAPEEPMPEEV